MNKWFLTLELVMPILQIGSLHGNHVFLLLEILQWLPIAYRKSSKFLHMVLNAFYNLFYSSTTLLASSLSLPYVNLYYN